VNRSSKSYASERRATSVLHSSSESPGDVRTALLVGVADHEVDARLPDGVGDRVGPLVVVVPRDAGAPVDDRFERGGDRVVLVGRDITDEDVDALGGVLGDVFERLCERVGPRGQQRDRGVRLVVLVVLIGIGFVGIGLGVVIESVVDRLQEGLDVESGIVGFPDQCDTAESVGIRIGNDDGRRAVDRLAGALFGATLVQRVGVEESGSGQQ